jgi:hypothetical protein
VSDGAGGWYLAGEFTRIGDHPAGGLAHVLADGTLDPAFLPVADGLVSALALDGDTLYAGGVFTSIGGSARLHLAALSTDDGAVLPFDAPQAQRVTELVSAPGRLYVGTDHVAALDPATGAPVAGFSSPVTFGVHALALGGNRLYVGGDDLVALDATTGALDPAFDGGTTEAGRAFHSLLWTGAALYAGSDRADRLVALDPATGAVDPGFDPTIPGEHNSVGVPVGVYDLALDGDRLWVAGSFGGGLAVVDADTGAHTGTAVPSYDLQVNTVELSGEKAYVGGYFYMSDFVRTDGIAALDAATLQPVEGFRVTVPAHGDLVPGAGALFVANTHFHGYDPSAEAAESHHFFSTTTWPVKAYDLDTGAALPGRSLKVKNLSGITTIGSRLYVARRLDNHVRFPRTRIDVYGATGTKVRSFLLPVRGYVAELSSIGGDLLAAGSFSGKLPRHYYRTAAMIRVDAITGKVRAFDPRITGPVYDIAVQGGSVFATGLFTKVYEGWDFNRPGLTKMNAQSRKDERFAPAGFKGNRVLTRVEPLGDSIWVSGGGVSRFLDAADGLNAVDPTGGWRSRIWSIAGRNDDAAFTSWIEPNLGGRDPYRLGFVAPVG